MVVPAAAVRWQEPFVIMRGRVPQQRSVRTFTAELRVSGHQYDHEKASAERQGHAASAKKPTSLDMCRQEETVMPAPHAPSCRLRVV